MNYLAKRMMFVLFSIGEPFFLQRINRFRLLDFIGKLVYIFQYCWRELKSPLLVVLRLSIVLYETKLGIVIILASSHTCAHREVRGVNPPPQKFQKSEIKKKYVENSPKTT